MNAQPLDVVILLFFRTAMQPNRTADKLRAAIATWLDTPEQLDSILRVLLDHRWLARDGRIHFALTPEGEAKAARALGLERLPARLRWNTARKLFLASALGVPCHSDKASHPDALIAAIVSRRVGLDPSTTTSLVRARDALVWRQLGVSESRPLTLEAVRRHLLAPLAEGDRVRESSTIVRQFAARSIGARSTSAPELQRAVLRRWLASGTQGLDAFAAMVISAGRRCRAGRVAEDRVFISHVARALGGDTTRLKERLVEANRRGILTLDRALLTSAMNPTDVADSEIRDGVAEYHLIILPAIQEPG